MLEPGDEEGNVARHEMDKDIGFGADLGMDQGLDYLPEQGMGGIGRYCRRCISLIAESLYARWRI